jgi:arsenate reductase (glutaredoxin)
MAARALLFGIPNCDTVKRARAWLTAHRLPHDFHDFKRQGLAPELARRWLAELGSEALINRRGSTWRALDAATQASASEADGAVLLMCSQPSVIKRPVVQWPDGSLGVGFDADKWARRTA